MSKCGVHNKGRMSNRIDKKKRGEEREKIFILLVQ